MLILCTPARLHVGLHLRPDLAVAAGVLLLSARFHLHDERYPLHRMLPLLEGGAEFRLAPDLHPQPVEGAAHVRRF